MKTPETLAEEWSTKRTKDAPSYNNKRLVEEWKLAKYSFLAGYRARDKEVADLKTNWTFCCEDKARLIKELGKAEAAAPQWISVKERLPDGKMVLVNCTDGYELGYYERYAGMGWTNTLGTESLNVTHWMPLPEPPKDE
jgi:hypothetical protein